LPDFCCPDVVLPEELVPLVPVVPAEEPLVSPLPIELLPPRLLPLPLFPVPLVPVVPAAEPLASVPPVPDVDDPWVASEELEDPELLPEADDPELLP
jgi:hypothetical protein